MNRQRLVGMIPIALVLGTPFAATTYSAQAAHHFAFADRLTNTSGWYLLASTACTAVGLLAITLDVIRRGN